MASPTAGPPVTTLSTPSGRPASCASAAKRSAESEVCSSGFSTTLLPAASAGGTFQPSRPIGQFQGSTAPTTPTGSLVMSASTDRSVGATSSYSLSIASPYHSSAFTAHWTQYSF